LGFSVPGRFKGRTFRGPAYRGIYRYSPHRARIWPDCGRRPAIPPKAGWFLVENHRGNLPLVLGRPRKGSPGDQSVRPRAVQPRVKPGQPAGPQLRKTTGSRQGTEAGRFFFGPRSAGEHGVRRALPRGRGVRKQAASVAVPEPSSGRGWGRATAGGLSGGNRAGGQNPACPARPVRGGAGGPWAGISRGWWPSRLVGPGYRGPTEYRHALKASRAFRASGTGTGGGPWPSGGTGRGFRAYPMVRAAARHTGCAPRRSTRSLRGGGTSTRGLPRVTSRPRGVGGAMSVAVASGPAPRVRSRSCGRRRGPGPHRPHNPCPAPSSPARRPV